MQLASEGRSASLSWTRPTARWTLQHPSWLSLTPLVHQFLTGPLLTLSHLPLLHTDSSQAGRD